ncbi:uncharacterized protein LOC116340010 [Contarinia nasturtii]|uniref:uncharacterized protein LOC116340010 n=1 Tax=Contarinia nasturtii TaxID=265458 RepID=UPI0012D470D0|nr:uncharacterized protein LOC116340010 [Contarinia nasturtii]
MDSLPKTPRKRNRHTVTERSLSYFSPIKSKKAKIENDVEIMFNDDAAKDGKTHTCSLCKLDFNGTKQWNLAAHLSAKHPNIYAEISGEKNEPIEVKRTKLLHSLVEIVSVNGRSFTHLLDSGYIKSIHPRLDELRAAGVGLDLHDSNLTEVKKKLSEIAGKIRDKIRDEVIGKHLSLMADIGTKHNRSILGVSIQYSVDGNLKIRSIGFIQLSESHTGIYLAEMIVNRLEELGIELKQIFTITTDNGKNILKMVRDVQSHLVSEINTNRATQAEVQSQHDNERAINVNYNNIDSEIQQLLANVIELTDDEALERCYDEAASLYNDSLLNSMKEKLTDNGRTITYDITGVNCAEHLLQLTVKDGVNDLAPNISNVIDLSREACKLLRQEAICNQAAKLEMEYSLPRLECATRWGSMYLMLRDIYDRKNIIEHFANANNLKLFQLLLQKWSILKELVIVLQIPYDVTIAFQNKRLTLSDVYGKWLAMQLHLEACNKKKSFKTDLAKHLLNAAKIRNEKIFSNPLMDSALYLDPRFQCEVTKCAEKTAKAKETLLNIWNRHQLLREDVSIHNETSVASAESLIFDFDVDEAITSHYGIHQNENEQIVPSLNISDLIDQFQPEIMSPSQSVLNFWEAEKTKNPELYILASIIFSVPPTEVQIERDFSSLDFVFTKRRGNLCQQRLEDIFIIHLNKDLFELVANQEIETFLEKC